MRLRTAKAVASRIDLNYFKKPHPLRRGRTWAVATCLVAAGAWAVSVTVRGDQRVYNPGPVAAAHAMFQNDCTACHAGDGGTGFLIRNVNPHRVTDAACLRCHDAAIHHVNQPPSSVRPHPSGQGEYTASCTKCHQEHRGDDALAASSDSHCLQCHRDLGAGNTKSAFQVQQSITGFGAGTHPPFGRHPKQGVSTMRLAQDGTLRDATAVAFPHSKHMPTRAEGQKEEQFARVLAQRCVQCHTTREPNPLARQAAPDASGKWDNIPSARRQDRHKDLSAPNEGGDMLPINFERHCGSCHFHRLELPGLDPRFTPTVAGGQKLDHLEMRLVRAQVENHALAPLRAFQIEETVPPADEFSEPTKRAVKPAEWLDRNVAMLSDIIRNTSRERRLPFTVRLPEPATQPASGTGAPVTTAASDFPRLTPEQESLLVNVHTAVVASTLCNSCHGVTGDLSAPGAGLNLATTPTGIPSSPRRWYANSRFDHDAHRSLDCLACHAEAPGSSTSSDLLVPGQDNCLQCHHAPTSSNRGAGASCVTCHVFHDRSKERAEPGRFTSAQFPAARAAPVNPPAPPTSGASASSTPRPTPSETVD